MRLSKAYLETCARNSGPYFQHCQFRFAQIPFTAIADPTLENTEVLHYLVRPWKALGFLKNRVLGSQKILFTLKAVTTLQKHRSLKSIFFSIFSKPVFGDNGGVEMDLASENPFGRKARVAL